MIVLNEHGGHGGVDAAPTALAVMKKYFELKAQDATSPPPRANQPYTPSLPPAPSLDEAALTRAVVPPPRVNLPGEPIQPPSETGDDSATAD